jgi:hypothetical protein
MQRVNPYYEKNYQHLSNVYSTIETNKANNNEINLCFFPFTNYIDMSMQNEMQIWQQNFCSPKFQIISVTPELKSRYEKNSYCYVNRGRLPNIPELAAILRTLGIKDIGVKYWTNNEIVNIQNNAKEPVAIYYANDKIMNAEVIHNPKEKAYTFCVSRTNDKQSIIANYKSKFIGENGQTYASKICRDCLYYEMPDVVLKH